MTDPQFTTRAELVEWKNKAIRNARAHEILGERTAVLEAIERIRRVKLAHAHLENDDAEWGCDYCRDDGKLTPEGTCPKCDAQYDTENDDAI